MEPEDFKPLDLIWHFPTDPETLFDAWTVPKIANQWYFKNETNTIKLETDTRVGGKFLVREWDKGNVIDHFGEYLEIEWPVKLVFTLEVPKHFEGISVINITIEQRQNESVLHFNQSGIDTSITKPAWEKMLANLEQMVRNSG
jgi:uncharacterized protein YndB with AHSA1/START domain